MRDVALAASGLLSPKVGGPSVFPPQPEGVYRFTQIDKGWKASIGPDRYRRGMYTYFWRSAPHPELVTFDAPDASSSCTRRSRSNTPLQALTLLNDSGFFEYAQGLAARIERESSGDETAKLTRLPHLRESRAERTGAGTLTRFLHSATSRVGDETRRGENAFAGCSKPGRVGDGGAGAAEFGRVHYAGVDKRTMPTQPTAFPPDEREQELVNKIRWLCVRIVRGLSTTDLIAVKWHRFQTATTAILSAVAGLGILGVQHGAKADGNLITVGAFIAILSAALAGLYQAFGVERKAVLALACHEAFRRLHAQLDAAVARRDPLAASQQSLRRCSRAVTELCFRD